MENVTEALHIAFGVLIFILALSISIHFFGKVRATTDSILQLRDRENDYSYIEQSADKERTVGVETIVPMLYRAFKENYIIVFKWKDPQPTKLVAQYMRVRKQGR